MPLPPTAQPVHPAVPGGDAPRRVRGNSTEEGHAAAWVPYDPAALPDPVAALVDEPVHQAWGPAPPAHSQWGSQPAQGHEAATQWAVPYSSPADGSPGQARHAWGNSELQTSGSAYITATLITDGHQQAPPHGSTGQQMGFPAQYYTQEAYQQQQSGAGAIVGEEGEQRILRAASFEQARSIFEELAATATVAPSPQPSWQYQREERPSLDSARGRATSPTAASLEVARGRAASRTAASLDLARGRAASPAPVAGHGRSRRSTDGGHRRSTDGGHRRSTDGRHRRSTDNGDGGGRVRRSGGDGATGRRGSSTEERPRGSAEHGRRGSLEGGGNTRRSSGGERRGSAGGGRRDRAASLELAAASPATGAVPASAAGGAAAHDGSVDPTQEHPLRTTSGRLVRAVQFFLPWRKGQKDESAGTGAGGEVYVNVGMVSLEDDNESTLSSAYSVLGCRCCCCDCNRHASPFTRTALFAITCGALVLVFALTVWSIRSRHGPRGVQSSPGLLYAPEPTTDYYPPSSYQSLYQRSPPPPAGGSGVLNTTAWGVRG